MAQAEEAELNNHQISISRGNHIKGPALAALLFLALCPPCLAEPALVIHYAPAENLERVDVALIDNAQHEIDLAAYVLTDWPVMQALIRAANRGVKVRIYNRCRR